MSLHLIEPDLGRISGGAAYNRALAEAAGPQIVRHSVPGSWIEPGPAESAAVHDLLATVDGPVLLDGLIATALPELITDPPHPNTTGQNPVIPLIHCLADDDDRAGRDRERRALAAAPAVITTSRFTAARLESRHRIRAETAPPGNPARIQSSPASGCHFVCIGAICENKGQLLLAEALEKLTAGGAQRAEDGAQNEAAPPWRVTFAGPVADAEYAERLRAACRALPSGRAEIVGELASAEIDSLYRQADLLLLPSRSEAYGMVVAEAAAAGIPAIVTVGTGAEEPLTAGRSLPRTVDAWNEALHRWLTDGEFRTELTEEARRRRPNAVRAWADTASAVLRTVGEHSRPVAAGQRGPIRPADQSRRRCS